MTDAMLQKFVKRWEEVVELPPQSLGPFTGLYKQVTRRLKVMPLPWFLLVSFVLVISLFLLLGTAVSSLVTLLQRGF